MDNIFVFRKRDFVKMNSKQMICYKIQKYNY